MLGGQTRDATDYRKSEHAFANVCIMTMFHQWRLCRVSLLYICILNYHITLSMIHMGQHLHDKSWYLNEKVENTFLREQHLLRAGQF